RSNGVMEPIHVNAAVGGRYTIIAGHRRTEASRRAGKLEIPAIVEHLDEDAANIMFDSPNLGQRKKLLPSERASAYFRLETAMQRKGIFGSKSTSLVSEVTGDNARSIQRYKRLMQLVPELMKKVDSGEIGFAVGVKLSFLPESRQEIINDVIEEKRLKNVKLEQIEAITSLSEVNRAGTQQIINILAPKKRVDATPSKDAKISIGKLLFAPYLPQGCTNREAEQIILKWAKQYKGEIT
ncbi:MAG: ParB/RepB/Spo0J family partition protein, partial [Oscillospiraceae bacterium]